MLDINICDVENCERKSYCKSYCNTHYARAWRYGSPGNSQIRLKRKKCSLTNCERKHFGKGLCVLHYQRQRIGLRLNEPIKQRYKHNLTKHKLYNTWAKMRDRCNNPNHRFYKNYGGRGIKVCERWDDFRLFLRDMGERPGGMSLDRYPDVNGDYEPGNCRWATRIEQQANRRGRG